MPSMSHTGPSHQVGCFGFRVHANATVLFRKSRLSAPVSAGKVREHEVVVFHLLLLQPEPYPEKPWLLVSLFSCVLQARSVSRWW